MISAHRFNVLARCDRISVGCHGVQFVFRRGRYYELLVDGSEHQPMTAFDLLVVIRLDGEQVSVRDAQGALQLLEARWIGGGDSHDRAVAACKAAVSGTGPSIAARATFCVAAMEAGIPFELFEDEFEAMASEIAEVARADVRETERGE